MKKLKKKLCALIMPLAIFSSSQKITHANLLDTSISILNEQNNSDSGNWTSGKVAKIVTGLILARGALDFAVKNVLLGDVDLQEEIYVNRVNNLTETSKLKVENLSDYSMFGQKLVINMNHISTEYDGSALNGIEYSMNHNNSVPRILDGKCVIVFGQAWSSAHRCVDEFPYIQNMLILGAKVVVYEYPERHSQGKSGISKYVMRSGTRILGAMEKIFQNLEKQYGTKNIIFSGHSLGGTVATNLCQKLMKDGKKIGGLILHTPAHADYDTVRTALMSLGTNESIATTAKWISWLLIDRFPGFPDMDTTLHLNEIVKKDSNFPIYLTSGNDYDPFYLKYTNLDKCLNKNSEYQVASILEESSKTREKIGHMDHKKMIWGKTFANWVKNSFHN